MNDVHQKLVYLSQLDKFRQLFAASYHQYQLRPTLTATEVDAANLPLPQQLRDFYLQVGNGGAGPHYGIFQLKHLFAYRPNEPYPGAEHYRAFAHANADEFDNFDDGYFEVHDDDLSGLIVITEEGCGHVTCIVSAGEYLGQMVSVSCDGFVRDLKQDFNTYYSDWLDASITLLERVKTLVDTDDLSLENIHKTIAQDLQRYDGYQLIMGVIGATVPYDKLNKLEHFTAWCAAQLTEYREQQQWRVRFPNKLSSQTFDWIPRFMERPVSFSHLAYKADGGSYKAPDMLELLLRFTAVAVLGGDPWSEMHTTEMEQQLRLAYEQQIQPMPNATDGITLAFKWLHAPLVGSWVHFEPDELMIGVEALCLLVQTVPRDQLAARLAVTYIAEDAADSELATLGETLYRLGATREDIEAAGQREDAAKSPEVLHGWDAVQTTQFNRVVRNAEPVNGSVEPLKREPTPAKSIWRSRIDGFMRSLVSGIVGGIVGGGLFGVVVLIIEQFDSPYDDPDLLSILMGIPVFFLIGAIFGLPFGFGCGVLYGAFLDHRVNTQTLPYYTTIGGGIIGALIGALLVSSGPVNDVQQMMGVIVLFILAGVAGAIGGRAGGTLHRFLKKR